MGATEQKTGLHIAGLTLVQLSAVSLIPAFSLSSVYLHHQSKSISSGPGNMGFKGEVSDCTAANRPKTHQAQKECGEMAAFSLISTDVAISSFPELTAANLDIHQHSLKQILLHVISIPPLPP